MDGELFLVIAIPAVLIVGGLLGAFVLSLALETGAMLGRLGYGIGKRLGWY